MPAGFLDPIQVEALPNGKDWRVLHEIRYVTKSGRVIYIPANFITDFASIPWFFRRIFQPATGRHRRAAVVHDWIYRTADLDISRQEADLIFLEIMELDGTAEWTREALFEAVSLFGGSSYKDRAPVGHRPLAAHPTP